MSANQSDTDGANVQLRDPAAAIEAVATNTVAFLSDSATGPALEPVLITSWAQFAARFGDFATAPGHLAHAVQGFFTNGGVRCFVVSVGPPGLEGAERDERFAAGLRSLDSTPEVTLIAAPGVISPEFQDAILAQCERRKDRFAILDCPDTAGDEAPSRPRDSKYGACYFPWLQVFDPEHGEIYVPPSGHVAGIYSRVDVERGVHAPPANEVVRGALGLRRNLTKQQQEALDAQGFNCIVTQRNAVRVWGARTLTADRAFRDIHAQRVAIMLQTSIERAIDWAFALPPDRALWERITRSISSFLLLQQRNGALTGQAPDDAFFVKCEAATAPPAAPPPDHVVVEVGVAITRPREFVVFRFGGA